MKKIILCFTVLLNCGVGFAQTDSDPFVRGVDVSFTPQIEDLGGKYKLNGVVRDALDIFKESGSNYVRLRLWHTPKDGYSGLAKTLEYAKRVKNKGFKFLLDIHYSDWWADPGKQTKPAAWTNLSFANLQDSVYNYTKNAITAFKNQNTLPDMVQVGNEITGGMLWPDGKISGTTNWTNFTALLKKGISGVKDAAGSSNVKIMIHIDRGGDNSSCRWFFDNLNSNGVSFDVIGLSYYPWWHGTLTQAKNNITDLAVRYNKDIIIAETAYPWTLQYYDNTGNIVGTSTILLSGYPANVKGQKDFLLALTKLLKDVPNKKGIGFFYWEPGYISQQPLGSSWENLTTFDFTGNALSSLVAFQNIDSLKSVKVKVRVNSSTLGDTLSSTGFIQVRGEVQGISSSLLPSGESVTWDANSQIVLKNTGGDYWEYQFGMYPTDQLQFKLWAGFNKNSGTYRNLGWEGPVVSFDSTNQNMRLFTAGAKDTILQIEYFNSLASAIPQYWSPFYANGDSIGVLFRVNTVDLMNKGIFNPDINGPVVLRGDPVTSAGRLSWETNSVQLKKEEISVANGSFWSAVVYFPKSIIKTGTLINYKFFVVNSNFGGWESGITNRGFNFPSTDTTLAWKYFNDKNVLTPVEENLEIPKEYRLYQNFPNPFNPETIIKYSLPERSRVVINIYNLLGSIVKTVVSEVKEAGTYSAKWNGTGDNGKSVVSGIYFIRLETGKYCQTRKAIFLQ